MAFVIINQIINLHITKVQFSDETRATFFLYHTAMSCELCVTKPCDEGGFIRLILGFSQSCKNQIYYPNNAAYMTHQYGKQTKMRLPWCSLSLLFSCTYFITKLSNTIK